MPHNITLIGGGSSTFTPVLMKLFIESQSLRGSTITLMDIDRRRLQVMEQLCTHLVRKTGAHLEVRSTTDRRESLEGADFVITSISVGGMDAWEHDIEIPAKYGIFMTTADSIGSGGIMRAWRHIPALAAVCRDLEEVSPDAWVLNYTNPATSIAIALRRASRVKVVSLCSGSCYPRTGAHIHGLDPADLMLPAPAAGLNHCTAVPALRFKDGRDALPAARAHAEYPVTRWVLDTYGVLPYPASHWVEFFPSLCRLDEPYQGRAQGLRMKYGEIHRMDHERDRVRKWEQLVERWAKGEDEEAWQAVLPESEGIEVVEIIESLIENRNEIFAVNVPNAGAVPNLPDEAIVEVSAVVNGYGIHPMRMDPLPEPLAAHLRQHIAVQELTAEAALTGSRTLALQAFLEDLHVQARLTPSEAEKLMDELLAVHEAYLPQFG
jgi:alpha-galactosidase